MKKENRQLAKEKKAKARAKAKRMKVLRQVGIIGIPALLVILLAVFVVYTSQPKTNNSSSDTNTETSTDTSTNTSTESTQTTLNTDTSLVVADGDTVNIDYVGTIDGVAFDGGNTQGNGTDLVIGSHSYIDDFEEQLIGHKVGETVEVVVTFPEAYGNEELNGKEAVFTTVINGIYK